MTKKQENIKDLLFFAMKYRDMWNSFRLDKETLVAVRDLAKRNSHFVVDWRTKQFRYVSRMSAGWKAFKRS